MSARRLLLGSYYLPQPDLDSSSRRLFHFVEALLDEGWEVVSASQNPAQIDRSGRLLRQRGVAVYELSRRTVEELAREQHFDIALLAFWHIAEPAMGVIRRLSPETRVIVDSMDLHFVRQARRVFRASREESTRRLLGASYASEAVRELNVYAAADVVLTVSRKEADLINDLLGDVARVVPDSEELPVSPLAFDDRRGIVFVGNFEHPPNAGAVEYLCEEIVPRLEPSLLAEHPVYIVGNHLSASLQAYGRALPQVRMVGWVPSVAPYLERARVAVAPLLFGAGTKRKIIQAWSIGTPVVSTSVGVEGFEARHGDDVLIADDPAEFAAAVSRLLRERDLWENLARNAREHVVVEHGRDAARARLMDAIGEALERPSNAAPLPEKGVDLLLPEQYHALIRRVGTVVEKTAEPGSVVLVATKGDPHLLELDGRTGWHFPQLENGQYAGYHPGDGVEAVAHLEDLRAKGAEFLVLPASSYWWLEEYGELRQHLARHFAVSAFEEPTCVMFDLRDRGGNGRAPSPARDARSAGVTRSRPPDISVVIPTLDRAGYLEATLESLASQSLPRDRYEVIVVDDGGNGETADVCRSMESRLRLSYHAIDRSGIASAKNHGLVAATAPIVLFFDDDDFADRNLLAEHVRAHEEYPERVVAVLGYTGWAPWLEVSELMHFVTDVGRYLFAYRGLEDGQRLDFTYFWGGRASCKRSLLKRDGIFHPEFWFGAEDIELGYRLSKVGLEVVFRREAAQWMNRTIAYDEFCRRCERQGASQWRFSRMHADPVVQRYCQIGPAEMLWEERAPHLEGNVLRVHDLEEAVAGTGASDERDLLVRELYSLYWWTFDAFKAKGIVEAMRAGAPAHERS